MTERTRPLVLLNPGPVNVSARVREALLIPDLCHRESEASDLVGSVGDKLLRAFAPSGGYRAALLSGSGTVAVEAAVSSAPAPGKKILVVNNGVYGDRIARMARAHGIDVVELSASWFDRVPTAAVDAALEDDPAIEWVALVHHETTTGLLNAVAEIGAVVRGHGRYFLVDSVSGLAGDDIDLAASGIDLCAGTSGKCVQGFPGIGFVLVAERVTEMLRRNPPRSVYLNLASHLQDDGAPPIPFTPALQILSALDVALIELLEEGVAGRISRYRDLAHFVRAGFSELGLNTMVREQWRSNCLTTFELPTGIDYTTLHDGLKDRGFIIYAGQGDLRERAFRIANMGTVSREQLGELVAATGELVAATGELVAATAESLSGA